MKYIDGQVAHIGDVVEYSDGATGVVVCSIDEDEYQASFTKENWSYLKNGIMVETESYGLIHSKEEDKDLKLLRRFGDS
ncbi:hypothetical protein [Microbulbifer variabilis]|uniref:hypothetical protein n=1 Tax=Microbulbifer variabilis TaxID=266805 RepID=UPI001CFD5027|nr:hypothetical protein [Microbulbifer variabilis]